MLRPTSVTGKWLQAVDQVHPPVAVARRRGRPQIYPPAVIIRCYLLMLFLPHLRQHARLHAYLCGHPRVCRLVGLTQVPHRTTFVRRFNGLEGELEHRIRHLGAAFISAGLVHVHVLLADGTLHQAAGTVWPSRFWRQHELPPTLRHVDQQAGWGRSPYRGWVWGYRSHVVVGLTAEDQPVPLLMCVAPGHKQDNVLLAQQLPHLPAEATVLVADSGYEDHKLVQQWERCDEYGIQTRWLVVPPKRRRGQPAAWRQQAQVRCEIEEVELPRLRSKRIEPFFGHWKAAFDLQVLPFQGTQARTFLLLAMYGYQLLVWNNLQAGRPTYAYKELLLDAL